MGCYAVLQLNWTPEKTNSLLLEAITVKLGFFRDYHGDSSYKLNILDCLRGLYMGCKIQRWFVSYDSTKYPQATNFHLDMNWITPGKYIAFKDPTIISTKNTTCVSKAVINELKRCGIKAVVRLNGNDHLANIEYYGPPYNSSEFKQEQFFHFEIPFEDVGIPSIAQINEFDSLCKRFAGKVAVHCHAGLGRTATMIGSLLIKNYGFDSRAVCGWLKMCRRGSVMGPQHFFLDKFQKQHEKFGLYSCRQISTVLLNTKSQLEAIQQHPIKLASTNRLPKGANNIIRIEKAQKKNAAPKYKFEVTAETSEVKPNHRAVVSETKANFKKDASKSNPPLNILSTEASTTNKIKKQTAFMSTNQLSVSRLNLWRNSIIPKRQVKTPQYIKTINTETNPKSKLSSDKNNLNENEWVTKEVVASREGMMYCFVQNTDNQK